MTHLKEGDKAPTFKGLIQDGSSKSLDDYKGKKLILYFYPKDNTPTCTIESCNLRDNYPSLLKDGYEVLGVSPDSARKHTGFISRFKLPFDLLADTNQEVMKAYGVWGPKKFMGREYIGVHRVTFVIDDHGIIEKIIDDVKAKRHTDQILN